MTTQQYQNLIPREATPSASSRLFAFYRIRQSNNQTNQQSNNSPVRFYPGDGAKLHFANRDVDTLEIPGVPIGFLAAGDVVTATYRGTCVFRGDVATIVEARNRGTDATQTVTCVGPWSKMQRLVYRQAWKTSSNAYSLSSRLILNQTKSGAAQNLDSELCEIAISGSYACGYTVEPSDVSVSTQILPSDECRDITVADAIKRELRFFPKAVAFFDYSGATPALKILKHQTPQTASYISNVPKNLREYVYNAHPITGVDLEIEATGTVNGVEYHNIDHQTAGDTTAGNTDCLYATLQIRGASSSTTRQSFKSVTEAIPANLNDVSWWKERHPRLANVASNAITITGGARSPANYPRISASTAGELEEAGLRCEVARFSCKATITTTDDKEEDVYLTLQYLTTNATGTAARPKTYTWVTDSSSESGETVPSGLAATILAERSGALLSERLSIRLGDALPTIGDAIVETEGTVFLQSFDVDCGSLTADLTFGVPEYLSPEDMASLLSGFRNKCTTSSGTVRTEGIPKTDATVEMGSIPPLSSSEFAPGTKAKTTINSAGSGRIVLDSVDLSSGENITVREMKFSGSSGEETTVKILSTEDIDLTKDGEEEDPEDPTEEDTGPHGGNDNCDSHPGSEGDGGVKADPDASGGAVGGESGQGGIYENGVPAGKDDDDPAGGSGIDCKDCK